MASPSYLLVLDQGSTSARAFLYNRAGQIAYLERTGLESLLLAPDRVEHDPAALLDGQIHGLRRALSWLLQFQADLFGREIGLANVYETTSRGAAYLAGLECGFWKDVDSLDRLNRPRKRFRPRLQAADVRQKYARWKRALQLAGDWNGTSL